MHQIAKKALLLLFVSLLIPPLIELATSSYFQRGFGPSLGLLGYGLFSFTLFFSIRSSWLEKAFGGLDKLSRFHHVLGLTTFGLIALHPIALAFRKFGPHIHFSFFMPTHHRFEVNLGVIAFWLLVLIVLTTVFKFFPYHRWKLIHRSFSLVFLLGTLHFWLDPFHYSSIPLYFFMLIGFCAIAYDQIYYPFIKKRAVAQIFTIQKIEKRFLKVELKSPPDLICRAGQYYFASFESPSLSREEHPFTLCQLGKGEVTLFIKKRGDFTKKLYQHLSVNDKVHLCGPYGVLNFKEGKKKQLWIAGGVGVVLFISWLEELEKAKGYQIAFYYCVHTRKDFLELERFKKCQSLDLHICCSKENTRLSIESIKTDIPDVAKRTVYLCGPKRLTRPLNKELIKSGVSRQDIQYEEFELM